MTKPGHKWSYPVHDAHRCELGNVEADEVAIIVGGEPQVGVENGLLNVGDAALVIGLHHQKPSFRRRNVCDLPQRRRCPIVIHLYIS